MSMLTGRLSRAGGDPVLRIGELAVPLAGYDGRIPDEEGREVILGVRPEHVRLLARTAAASRPSSTSTSRWAPTAWSG